VSGKRELPLDDPRWVPSTELHRQRWEHVGDPQLAARDLTEAHRSKRICSMRRPIYSGVDPDREQLSSSFWIEYEYWWWAPKKTLQVRARAPRRNSPGPDGFINPAFNYVYFGWGPDFDEVWWSGVTGAETISPAVVAEKKETEQTKRLQLPNKLAAALKPPAEADDASDKDNKGKIKRLTRQQRIAKAIVDQDFPNGVPDEVPTKDVEGRISDKWQAKCDELLIDWKTVRAPKWHAVNRLLGRGRKR
jgi:hypothetical protein